MDEQKVREIHDFLDDYNAKYGSASKLCLFCGSGELNPKVGIKHLPGCVIVKLRKLLAKAICEEQPQNDLRLEIYNRMVASLPVGNEITAWDFIQWFFRFWKDYLDESDQLLQPQEVPSEDTCPECDGWGYDRRSMNKEVCPVCQGEGKQMANEGRNQQG